MVLCVKCSKELAFNDIGAHKKFINRDSTEFMCVHCLSKELKIPEKIIYMKKLIFLKSTDARFLIIIKQRRMWSDKTYTALLISDFTRKN